MPTLCSFLPIALFAVCTITWTSTSDSLGTSLLGTLTPQWATLGRTSLKSALHFCCIGMGHLYSSLEPVLLPFVEPVKISSGSNFSGQCPIFCCIEMAHFCSSVGLAGLSSSGTIDLHFALMEEQNICLEFFCVFVWWGNIIPNYLFRRCRPETGARTQNHRQKYNKQLWG